MFANEAKAIQRVKHSQRSEDPPASDSQTTKRSSHTERPRINEEKVDQRAIQRQRSERPPASDYTPTERRGGSEREWPNEATALQ